LKNNTKPKPLLTVFRVLLIVLFGIFFKSNSANAEENSNNGVNPYYGSFSTEVPIAVPAYHGLEPKLKLVYNSGGRNTWIGVGWNLSGESEIVRASSGGGSPRYDESDVFYMDGVELLPCTSQGGTHCPKIQNFTRIRQDTENNRWIVWGTNGNQATYEPIYNTSKGTFRWLLSELKDPNGNTVHYNYWIDGDPAKAIYLDSITYNGTEIKFYREKRSDPIIYSTGAELGWINFRLKTIDILVSENRVRTYALSYLPSPNTSRSLLESVQQYGNDAVLDEFGRVTEGTSLPSMTFGRLSGGAGAFGDYRVTAGPGGEGAGYINFGDVNGDGRADLIKHDSAGLVYTFLSNGDGTFGTYTITEGPGGEDAGYIHIADVNGDGRDDLVKQDADGNVYTFLSNGDGTFGDPSTTATNAEEGAGFVRLTDVNGDGRMDLVTYDSTGLVHIFIADENGLLGGPSGDFSTHDGSGGDGEGLVILADLNADGQADLIKLKSNGNIYTYLSDGKGDFEYRGTIIDTCGAPPCYVNFFDINGDGSADLVTHNSKGQVYSHISKGDGTFDNRGRSDGAGHVYYADINSDGRVDVIRYNSAGEVSSYISKGDGAFEYLNTAQGPGGEEEGFVNFADIDGDGLLDLVKQDSKGQIYVYLSEADGVTDLIKFVANGIGGATEIEYTPSSEWDNTFLPAGMVVQTISALTTSDGRGNSSTTTYQYAGGLWSIEEHRFFGFRKVTSVIDPQGNYTETYYFQRIGSISKPEYTYFKDNQGNLFSYSKYEYTENEEPPYTSFLTARWEYNCNLSDNCLITLTQFAYDQYGNVLATFEWGDYNRDGDERTTVRGYYPNAEAYIRGLPAYENMYAGIGTTGDLLQQKLYYYDGNSSYVAPPSKGNLTQVRKWNDQTGSYVSVGKEYDPWGNVVREIDERGYDSTISYDDIYHVFPVEQCNYLGHCRSIDWDMVMSLKNSVTDENQATVLYRFDPLGRVKEIENPDQSIIYHTYNDYGNPENQHLKIIYPDGTSDGYRRKVYQDGLGRKYKTVKEGTSGDLIKEKQYIGTSSRIAQESLWYSSGETPRWISYTYDGAGRLRTAVNPDGKYKETVYGIDQFGQHFEATYDELGREKVFWKDVYGNLIQIREKNGPEYYYTNYEYNLLGKLLRAVDAMGNVSTFTWDSIGRKLETCTPDTGCWSYAYDDAGLLISQTDAKGQTINFSYDELGRIKTKTPPDASQTQYFYDEKGYGASKGKPTRVVYPNGSESQTYDQRGLPVSTTRCVDGTCLTMGQDYDSLGRVKSVAYPDGEVVNYTYDDAGRAIGLSGYVNEMAWNASGQLNTYSFANGTSARFTYDENRLWLNSATVRGSDGNALYDAGFTYGDSALVNSIISTTDPLKNVSYSYDDLNRLIGVSGNQHQEFNYDAVGNRTYTNQEDPPLAGIHDRDFTYDANGNMTTDGHRIFSWNSENRLTSVQKDNRAFTFLYNDQGERIQKSGPGSTIQYFGGLVEIVNGKMVKYYFVGSIIVARQDETGKYWYHSDRLGSVQIMTDINGQKVNSYEFAAFGWTLENSGSAANSIGFTGQINDLEIGLIYMGARYYDPLLGRFISPDSVVPDPADPQALNRYAYAYNNPISNIDPGGHAPVAVALVSTVFTTAAWSAGAVNTWVAMTAWVGAGLTVAGQLADDPLLSALGSVMLGISNGAYLFSGGEGSTSGILGAFAAGVDSAEGSPGTFSVVKWAYNIFGSIKELDAALHEKNNKPSDLVRSVLNKLMGEKPGDYFTIGLTFNTPWWIGVGGSFDRVVMPNGESDWFFTAGGGAATPGIFWPIFHVDKGKIAKLDLVKKGDSRVYLSSDTLKKEDIKGFTMSGNADISPFGFEGIINPFVTSKINGVKYPTPIIAGKGGIRIGLPGANLFGNWTIDIGD
jgi:RHS repeat-associated protein